MGKSALVIGIGTSGYHMILSSLKYYYEFTKIKQPENVAFMFLETASQDGDYIKNNIVSSVRIGSDNITAQLNRWKGNGREGLDLSWVPSESDMKDLHDGADGKPAFGRFCLWAKLTEVRETISAMYGKIGGGDDTSIYIVGSLVGGTGSGIFLDVAGLVRTVTSCRNIYGLFMLPSCGDLDVNGKEIGFENAYLSLKTLDYYSKSNNNSEGKKSYYGAVLPTGSNIALTEAPFRHVYYFTRDFNSADAPLRDVVPLVESAGFNLAMRIMNITEDKAPFQETINVRVGDYTAGLEEGNGIFATVGMMVFQYPSGLLEEFLGTTLIKERFLEPWNDASYCIMPDGKKRDILSLKGLVERKANEAVQSAISSAIQKCRGLLKNDATKDPVQDEIELIIDKKYKNKGYDSDVDYVSSLFATNNSSNLYANISNHEMTLRDEMVDRFTEFIYVQSLEFPNLNVVKMLLESLVAAMKATISRWKSQFQIDGTFETWNNIADELIDNRINKGKLAYTLTTTKAEHLYEAIDGVMQLCYFNLAVNVMKSISDSIESKDGVDPLQTMKYSLPTMTMASQLIQKVAHLLDPKKDNSIMKRHGELESKLKGSSNSQFVFLFKGNDYKSDLSTAKSVYDQKQYSLKLKELTSGTGLWEFLEKNTIDSLRTEIIDKITMHVHEKQLFDGNDIVSLLNEKKASDKKVRTLLTGQESDVRSLVPPMCKLDDNYNFERHDALKLMIISDKTSSNAKGITNHMSYKASEGKDSYVQLSSMANTVVVYQEYRDFGEGSTFNPVLHIDYQKDVLARMKKKSADQFKKNLKLAYIDFDNAVSTDNIKIK